jgi:hypothetical protein
VRSRSRAPGGRERGPVQRRWWAHRATPGRGARAASLSDDLAFAERGTAIGTSAPAETGEARRARPRDCHNGRAAVHRRCAGAGAGHLWRVGQRSARTAALPKAGRYLNASRCFLVTRVTSWQPMPEGGITRGRGERGGGLPVWEWRPPPASPSGNALPCLMVKDTAAIKSTRGWTSHIQPNDDDPCKRFQELCRYRPRSPVRVLRRRRSAASPGTAAPQARRATRHTSVRFARLSGWVGAQQRHSPELQQRGTGGGALHRALPQSPPEAVLPGIPLGQRSSGMTRPQSSSSPMRQPYG